MKNDDKIGLLVVMFLLSISNSLCISFYIPAFPEIAKYFHASPGIIKSSLTLFMLFFGIGQFIFGCILDRVGIKWGMFCSLLAVFTGSFLIVITKNIYIFMLGRCLQGVGSAGISVTTKSVLSNKFKSNVLPQVFSILMIGMTLTPLVVPILGGYIAHYLSWKMIFVIIAAYSVVLLSISHFYLNHDKKEIVAGLFSDNFKKYFHVIKNEQFILLVTALVLIYGFQPIYLSTLPFLFKGLSSSRIGNLMAIPVLFELASILVVTTLNKRLGEKVIIKYGLAISLFGIALLALSYNFGKNDAIYIAIFMGMIIFGGGLIFPNLLSKALRAHPETSNHASATLGIFQQIGGAIIIMLISLLQIQSQLGLSLILFLCLILAGYIILRKQRIFYR